MSTTKGGNIRLESVSVPDSLVPGEEFTAEVVVTNTASFIGPLDPDLCETTTRGGYAVEVDIDGPGDSYVRSDCLEGVGSWGQSGETETFTVPFTAPRDQGEATVEARVRLPGSGKSTGWVSDTAHVTDDGLVTYPEDDSEDSTGGGDLLPDLGGDGDGDGDLVGGIVPDTLALLVLLVAVGYVLSGAGDIAQGVD